MIEDSIYWKKRKLKDERRDWRNGGLSWVDEYVKSKEHPHRVLLTDSVGHCLPREYDNETILEIGCNAGPNISLLRDKFPYLKDHNLFGLDINKDSIRAAKKLLPAVNWSVGSVIELPYKDKSMDIVLIDAVLMYISDTEIDKAIEEINRVCKRAIVICDWYDDSIKGIIKDYHWSRNYPVILQDLGFKVKIIQLTEKEWPSKNWTKNGCVFVAQVASPTSKKS